jgi:hypothetical protein
MVRDLVPDLVWDLVPDQSARVFRRTQLTVFISGLYIEADEIPRRSISNWPPSAEPDDSEKEFSLHYGRREPPLDR